MPPPFLRAKVRPTMNVDHHFNSGRTFLLTAIFAMTALGWLEVEAQTNSEPVLCA